MNVVALKARDRALGMGLLALTALGAAAAQSVSGKNEPAKPQYPNPETARLEMLEGPWAFSVYDARGTRVAEGTEEVRWALDKHVLHRSYTYTLGDTVYRAMGMLAWDDTSEAYVGVWFDNGSTSGPSSVRGTWNESTRTMTSTLQKKNDKGVNLEYKVVEQFTGDELREATTYELVDDDVFKRMVVKYKRTVPCPSKKLIPMGG